MLQLKSQITIWIISNIWMFLRRTLTCSWCWRKMGFMYVWTMNVCTEMAIHPIVQQPKETFQSGSKGLSNWKTDSAIHRTVAGSVKNTSNTLLIHMGIWGFVIIVIQILTFPPQFSIDLVLTTTINHLDTWGGFTVLYFTEIVAFSSFHLIYYKIYLQVLRPAPVLPCPSFISEVNLIIGQLMIASWLYPSVCWSLCFLFSFLGISPPAVLFLWNFPSCIVFSRIYLSPS